MTAGRAGVMSKPAAAAAGGTFTIYPSSQAGRINSLSGVSYADARAGANLGASPGTGLVVGQIYIFDPEGPSENWSIYEVFLDFDTSVVTGTIASATLSLGLETDASDTDFTIQARARDWGATLTTADWVAGGSLGALTTLATLATSGIGSTGAYKAFTESGSALRSAINQAGVTRMLLCSDRHVGNNEPTGNEYVEAYTYNHATLKPKLVVVTT